MCGTRLPSAEGVDSSKGSPLDLSFHIAQNGLRSGTIRQSMIANNLSNLTTDGYRAKVADPATIHGPGTQIVGVRDSQQQGGARNTGQDSDVYIAGGRRFFR